MWRGSITINKYSKIWSFLHWTSKLISPNSTRIYHHGNEHSSTRWFLAYSILNFSPHVYRLGHGPSWSLPIILSMVWTFFSFFSKDYIWKQTSLNHGLCINNLVIMLLGLLQVIWLYDFMLYIYIYIKTLCFEPCYRTAWKVQVLLIYSQIEQAW
jgi:hypothetical protein